MFFDEQWKAELKPHRDDFLGAQVDLEAAGSFFAFQKSATFAAFVVRKQIEDVAVTDRLQSKSIEVAAYPSTRNEPVFLEVLMSDDLLQVEEHFDLQKPSGVRLSYSDLASEIIHADGFGDT
jgi:hypothetical protein